MHEICEKFKLNKNETKINVCERIPGTTDISGGSKVKQKYTKTCRIV